jgi:hypothetical protein
MVLDDRYTIRIFYIHNKDSKRFEETLKKFKDQEKFTKDFGGSYRKQLNQKRKIWTGNSESLKKVNSPLKVDSSPLEIRKYEEYQPTLFFILSLDPAF